jgi:hypothetical protein
VSHDTEEPPQREESLARHLARAERPVELELREGVGRRGEAERDLAPGGLHSDERIEKRKGAGHVGGRTERLDQLDLEKRCLQLGRADVPGNARGHANEGPALAVFPGSPRGPVLGEPPPEIAGLADVD